MKLPRTTHYYLRAKAKPLDRSLIWRLHRWMQSRRLVLADLRTEHVRSFIERPHRRKVAPATRAFYRQRIVRYLEWLQNRGHVSLDLTGFHPPRPAPLPVMARRFLDELTSTLAPGTCQLYKAMLRDFHLWLTRNEISLGCLARDQMPQYCRHLKDQGLHPATRVKKLFQLRTYLCWLHEREAISVPPYDLLRTTDFPKLPSYLPRPLPPLADHELRRRLADSSCIYQKGLLLMRNTGVRIGELISLDYDCVRADHRGNRFLKVPLGKLKSERLVPITDETFELIQQLRDRGRPEREWLLESPTGKKTSDVVYNRVLREACHGLDIPDKVTSHRLRHSAATSLLEGGMSLTGVMKILGHTDYRMTLRYTAITQETVGREYHDALSQLEERYKIILQHPRGEELDPVKMLSDVRRWIQNVLGEEQTRVVRSLLRRLRRMQNDVRRLVDVRR